MLLTFSKNDKDISLRNPSTQVTVNDVEKINKISTLLIDELARHKNGVGISAPQIGIFENISIINNGFIVVNPIITESNGSVLYEEGCLSFPGCYVKTIRFKEVTVHCDMIGKIDDIIKWEYDKTLFFDFEQDELSCIVIQHEIDHLNGILMFERRIKSINVDHKYKPNDFITIQKGENVKTIKYKKVKDYTLDGWTIKE